MATLRYIGFSWQDVGARRWKLEESRLLARGGVSSEDTPEVGPPVEHGALLIPELRSDCDMRTDFKLFRS